MNSPRGRVVAYIVSCPRGLYRDRVEVTEPNARAVAFASAQEYEPDPWALDGHSQVGVEFENGEVSFDVTI